MAGEEGRAAAGKAAGGKAAAGRTAALDRAAAGGRAAAAGRATLKSDTQAIPTADTKPDSRRRGEALEDALLTAARDELHEVGYSRLSMKRVAERAQTSRSVLSRRWDNRVEMVLSVLRMEGSLFEGDPQDTGSLRGDMLDLMQRYVQRYRGIGTDVLMGIITDCLSGTAASFDLPKNMQQADLAHTCIIVQRAIDRGEALPNISDFVMALPLELLRAALLIGGEPAQQPFLEQILDEAFLPLVLA